MIPIDGQEHILKSHEIQAIRDTLCPRVLIPMHHRHPDLELADASPHGLGPIDPWLATQKNVTRLETSHAVFTTASRHSPSRIVVLPHSTKVRGD